MKVRALLLFSGGLDSILAAKILQKQGIEVTGLVLVSYFFNDEDAKNSAKIAGINLIKRDISDKHFRMVLNPEFSYGKNMNPCIDCHLMIAREAWNVKKQQKFDILASGEVLGQRAFSQTKWALDVIERKFNEEIEVLRPLSAKLLKETSYEKNGLVKRSLLEDVSGKNRSRQFSMASDFGIEKFPTPSGGCLLTETGFVSKLKTFIKEGVEINFRNFELLKIGRHFYKNKVYIVLGRSLEENLKIESLAENFDFLLKRNDEKGPTAIFSSELDGEEFKELKEFVCKLIFKYSKHSDGDWKSIKYKLCQVRK